MELVPLEEYLSTVYEPDAEFVDGLIEERVMGEDDHSSWQAAITGYFVTRAVEWNLRVRPELRSRVADRRYRVPDLAILDGDAPKEPIAVHPPLAIFEILSPEDRHKRLLVRLADFERMGVRSIYVIDPEDGAMFRFEAGVLAPATRISIPARGIDLALAEIASWSARSHTIWNTLHCATSRSPGQGSGAWQNMVRVGFKSCMPMSLPGRHGLHRAGPATRNAHPVP